MKERPILFQAAMVRAILDGSKTQTRRVVKPVGKDDAFALVDYGDGWWPYRSDDGESSIRADGNETPILCPYGKVGDRLWVREAWRADAGHDWAKPTQIKNDSRIFFDADGKSKWLDDLTFAPSRKARPSIHMPRWASRINLEITGVRVERLNDISEADAVAEGTPCYVCGASMDGRSEDDCHCFHSTAKPSDYRMLWEHINGTDSWDANPWVWVVEFQRETT